MSAAILTAVFGFTFAAGVATARMRRRRRPDLHRVDQFCDFDMAVRECTNPRDGRL